MLAFFRVPGKVNPADPLTKYVVKATFLIFRKFSLSSDRECNSTHNHSLPTQGRVTKVEMRMGWLYVVPPVAQSIDQRSVGGGWVGGGGGGGGDRMCVGTHTQPPSSTLHHRPALTTDVFSWTFSRTFSRTFYGTVNGAVMCGTAAIAPR